MPSPPREYTNLQIAQTIDHALLKPEMTRDEVIDGCLMAASLNLFSVCVRPCDIELAIESVRGGTVVGTVIGFPHGVNTTKTKASEAEDALRRGVAELDMVINVSAVKSGDLIFVEEDIREVVKAASGHVVKVILETAYLSEEQIVEACLASENAGASFVKTSTGFAGGGATLDHVRLMRATVGPNVQVKASGGIRTREDAVAMLDAGATRLGTSSAKAILGESGSVVEGSY